jgi:hypothetical protein
LIPGLSKEIATTLEKTVYATGDTYQKWFYICPKSWGTPEFMKGTRKGFMIEIFNVGGTLTSILDSADVTTPITIENEFGHIEEYQVWETYNTNAEDPTEPIVISKI